MSPSDRLRCRCGQQFTAWLINGAPRSRCPFCKAPVSQSTELVHDAEPPGSEAGPFAAPQAKFALRQAAPADRRIRVPRDPRSTSAAAGVQGAIVGGLAGLILWEWFTLPAALATGLLAAAVGFFWGKVGAPRRVPRAAWALACPRCGSEQVVRSAGTWWGGWIGTRLARHVECTGCGKRYIGTTGDDDQYAIITAAAARAAVVMVIVSTVLVLKVLRIGF